MSEAPRQVLWTDPKDPKRTLELRNGIICAKDPRGALRMKSVEDLYREMCTAHIEETKLPVFCWEDAKPFHAGELFERLEEEAGISSKGVNLGMGGFYDRSFLMVFPSEAAQMNLAKALMAIVEEYKVKDSTFIEVKPGCIRLCLYVHVDNPY
jgi:hypothetical protein